MTKKKRFYKRLPLEVRLQGHSRRGGRRDIEPRDERQRVENFAAGVDEVQLHRAAFEDGITAGPRKEAVTPSELCDVAGTRRRLR